MIVFPFLTITDINIPRKVFAVKPFCAADIVFLVKFIDL